MILNLTKDLNCILYEDLLPDRKSGDTFAFLEREIFQGLAKRKLVWNPDGKKQPGELAKHSSLQPKKTSAWSLRGLLAKWLDIKSRLKQGVLWKMLFDYPTNWENDTIWCPMPDRISTLVVTRRAFTPTGPRYWIALRVIWKKKSPIVSKKRVGHCARTMEYNLCTSSLHRPCPGGVDCIVPVKARGGRVEKPHIYIALGTLRAEWISLPRLISSGAGEHHPTRSIQPHLSY